MPFEKPEIQTPEELAHSVLDDIAKEERWTPEQKTAAEKAIDTAKLQPSEEIPSSNIDVQLISQIETEFPGSKIGAPKEEVRGMYEQIGIYTIDGHHQEDISAIDVPGSNSRTKFDLDSLITLLRNKNYRDKDQV